MRRATQASCRGRVEWDHLKSAQGIHGKTHWVQYLTGAGHGPYLTAAMRVHRKLTAAICQVLIGLLLFAQAAFATGPCVEGGMSAAAAVAAATAAEEHDCCETSVSEANLCVSKCTDGDKVSAHTPLLLPPDFCGGTGPPRAHSRCG